jgi:hypothetical protein
MKTARFFTLFILLLVLLMTNNVAAQQTTSAALTDLQLTDTLSSSERRAVRRIIRRHQRMVEDSLKSGASSIILDSLDMRPADGKVGLVLAGGYRTAVGARNCAENKERIHVINSKSLAGPLRYMAKKAVALMERGMRIEEIKKELEVCVESSMSFVIPEDFAFLKRSGRLTALTAKVGGMLKLLPVLTQTEDKTRIKPLTVKRTWRAAVDVVIEQMMSRGVNGEYLISVCHTGTHCRAQAVLKQLQAVFPRAKFEVLTLSPALITHGGPGCIVVQAVKL